MTDDIDPEGLREWRRYATLRPKRPEGPVRLRELLLERQMQLRGMLQRWPQQRWGTWPEPALSWKTRQKEQERTVCLLAKWQEPQERTVPGQGMESGELTDEAIKSLSEIVAAEVTKLREAEAAKRVAEEQAGSAAKSAPEMRVDKIRARSRWAFPAGPHPQERASGVLEWVAKRVPKRINTEEIGDALEKIHRLVAEGRSSWSIYLAVAKAFFWVGVHTVLHPAERLLNILEKFATGQGHDRR
ncbi:hypothetical protein [Hyalangium sp.]|uniref:hypothetical protein n=1 Tax=Hyalangium sp. TaxID=2028555 RepID=UPI002D6811DA|nr:hypothetical protein [Hyalangium sp.]HYI01546.1 hypothetical protein [Hyalangium sp.]